MTKQRGRDQLHDVKVFFDHISERYAAKYQEIRPYHQWYFNDRLEKALRFCPKDANARILDIGAGTGALYQKMLDCGMNPNYLACDISEEMLNQSSIPPSNRFTGSAYEAIDDRERFDWIAMLGVTTYFDDDELRKNLDFIRTHLDEGGTLAITFTNSKALGLLSYRIFSPLLRLLGSKKHVAAQPFQKTSFSLQEIRLMLEDDFELLHVDFLNQTIFPLSHLLPKLSVSAAKRLQRLDSNNFLLQRLSAEILLHVQLKNSK